MSTMNRVVAITGCDSGLGWAIAARLAREGLVTVAGLHNGLETEAAKALANLCAHPVSLDVTSEKSVLGFRNYVQDLLKDNPEYKLYAVVNNAGVMTVGEYECLTSLMVESMINVNLLGAMRIASAFLPDLRRNALDCVTPKPRIINIASHCGVQPLPYFAPYSASKAGVLAWSKALRLEQRDHGLSVSAVIPGGFVTSSNILGGQKSKGEEMLENLTEEQKSFYGKRIATLSNYLGAAAQNTSYDGMRDDKLLEVIVKALTDENPKELYKVETWRYFIYYTMMKLPLPESLYHWIVKRFLSFPELK